MGRGAQGLMDARTNIEARLPSRHMTEAHAWAPRRSARAAVFKKTPYIAESKSDGRFIAKDIFEVGAIPLLTLSSHGFLQDDCMTVMGRAVAENSVTPNPKQLVELTRHADA